MLTMRGERYVLRDWSGERLIRCGEGAMYHSFLLGESWVASNSRKRPYIGQYSPVWDGCQDSLGRFWMVLTKLAQTGTMGVERREALMGDEDTYVTATEARELLQVSKGKLTAMIKSGEIPTYPDPRHKQAKLIKMSDINEWLAKAVRPPRPHRTIQVAEQQHEGDDQKINRAA